MSLPMTLPPPAMPTPARPTPALPSPPRRQTPIDRLFRGALVAVSRLAGVRIRVARSAAERADAEAVAAAVLGERRGRVPPSLRSIGARYDAMATTLVAYDEGRPVGTMTLYLPTDSSRTVESAPLRLPDGIEPRDVVDIGRLAVLPSHRGGARLVLLGLLGAAQRFSERAGRRWWVGMTSPKLVEVFRRLNPTARPLPRALVDERPAAVVLYWIAYREGAARELAPFIMANAGASPVRILTRHCARLLRGRLSRGR